MPCIPGAGCRPPEEQVRRKGMGMTFYRQPELEQPVLIAGWPGIGNIGIAAVDTVRGQVQAEEFGEIEPWHFFYPREVSIKNGLLAGLEFPRNKFYHRRLEKEDLVVFIGEEQPSEGRRMYAEGDKAFKMANLVIDAASEFGCRRVYTSGACVSPIHHSTRPRVVAVVTSEKLKDEAAGYPNTVLISEIGGRESQGVITGLNGLLLTVARKRGLEGICLMGEIPDWLAGVPFPYPRASRSVLEVFAHLLGIEIDFGTVDEMTREIEGIVEPMYEKFPPEIRDRYDQRKLAAQAEAKSITEEDARWIKEHLDDLLKKKKGNGDRPV